MKVYRDVDGKPELTGECDFKWNHGGPFPEAIVTHRPACDGSVFDTKRIWQTALVISYDDAGRSHSEYAIKLRPEDDPEHLPGWRPLTSVKTSELQEGASLPFEISPGLVTYVSRSSASVHLPEMSEGQSITIRNTGSEPLMVYGAATSLAASPCVTDEPDRRRFRGIPIHIQEQLLTTPSVELPTERPLTIEEMVHDLWDVAKGAAYPSWGYAVPKIFWDRAIGHLTEVRRRTEEAFQHESAAEIVAHDWRYAAKVATIVTTERDLSAEAQGLVESFQAAPTEADLEEMDKRINEAFRSGPAWHYAEAKRMRDKSLDPDGDLVSLPQKPQPEEKPYIPQKWGEHD